MTLNQGTGRGADQWTDVRAHELRVPGIELQPGMTRQRRQLKVEESLDVQRSSLVVFVELEIARLMHFAVENALADQELRPFEIRVAGKERVVQIK